MAAVTRFTGRTMIALLAGSCALLPLVYPDWRVEAQARYYQEDVEEEETVRCGRVITTAAGNVRDESCVVAEDNEGEIRLDNGFADVMGDNDGYIRNIC